MDLNRVTTVRSGVKPSRALISTADKSGLSELLPALWEISPPLVVYSTGGTFEACRLVAESVGRANAVRRVTELTGQPEMQGGLVKTLDWKIYLALLSEDFNDAHRADLDAEKTDPFDLVVCNFYPFERAVGASGSTIEDARANIDIGGPTMVRAAAKNFLRLTVLTDPSQYDTFLRHLAENGGKTSLPFRHARARDAFARIAAYDRAISDYLATTTENDLTVYRGG